MQSPVKEAEKSNYFTFNWAVFSLLLGLSFSYVVYYSQKLTDIESKIQSNIIEINAVNVPMPFGPITGHKDYTYLKRSDALRNDLLLLFGNLSNPNIPDRSLEEIGQKLHKTINQIAYFSPFARLLEFKENGSVELDPNNRIGIDISKPIDMSFLKTQIDEIYNWNNHLTVNLKDKKKHIVEAIALEPGIAEDKLGINNYMDKLIDYLENYHKLGMKLGLLIKEYDYILQKINKRNIISLFSLVSFCFICGIILPLLKPSLNSSRIITGFVLIAFSAGVFLLFKAVVYSVLLKIS